MSTDEERDGRIEDAIDRADATMLSQAEREMDLKTFIREERIKSDLFLKGFERRTEEMSEDIRANTAATWAMVDEIRGWSR